MADQKITALTVDTLPTKEDLLVSVNDPNGTPVNRKVPLGQAFFTQLYSEFRTIGVNSRPNASTTPDTFGHAAVTPFADNAVNSDDADGPFRRYDTAAANASGAGMDFNNGGLTRTAWLPQCWMKLKTHSSIAVCRIWAGFHSASPTADDPAQHGAAFRYSTAVGDTNWQAWTNDGSGGGAITDTGVAVATSTLYHFAIFVESTTSIKFYISVDNGLTWSLVATHTTNLPTSSQGMNHYFQIETLENVAKSLHHSFTYIRMR